MNQKMELFMNENFAVIDTETNWYDQVMSIGLIIAEDNTYKVQEEYYGLITPECEIGGMYSMVLRDGRTDINNEASREEILKEIDVLLKKYGVKHLFAYNAKFDENHLPELTDFSWVDIMQTTMYRQYNPFIPDRAQLCNTGKLKSGYGVEAVLNMITGEVHQEVHNALCDTRDELFIMSSFDMPIQHFIENAKRTSSQKSRDYGKYVKMRKMR